MPRALLFGLAGGPEKVALLELEYVNLDEYTIYSIEMNINMLVSNILIYVYMIWCVQSITFNWVNEAVISSGLTSINSQQTHFVIT